jgi:hypothetical protein
MLQKVFQLAWQLYHQTKKNPQGLHNAHKSLLKLCSTLQEWLRLNAVCQMPIEYCEDVEATCARCLKVLSVLDRSMAEYGRPLLRSKRASFQPRKRVKKRVIERQKSQLVLCIERFSSHIALNEISILQKLELFRVEWCRNQYQATQPYTALADRPWDQQLWIQLDAIGISTHVWNIHRDVIIDWFAQAVLESRFCPQVVEDDVKSVGTADNSFWEVDLQSKSSEYCTERSSLSDIKTTDEVIRPRDIADQPQVSIPDVLSLLWQESHPQDRLRRLLYTDDWSAVLKILSYENFIAFVDPKFLSEIMVSAAEKGLVHVVEALLQNGASADWQDSDRKTALFGSIHSKNFEIFAMLVEAGADIDGGRPGFTSSPLVEAAKTGQLDMVKYIISHQRYTHIDSYSLAALKCAAQANHSEIVYYLLDSGVEIEAVNVNGETALSPALGCENRYNM